MKEFPQLPLLILDVYTYKCHTHTFNLLRYCQIFICRGTLEVHISNICFLLEDTKADLAGPLKQPK